MPEQDQPQQYDRRAEDFIERISPKIEEFIEEALKKHICNCETEEFKDLMEFIKTQKELEKEKLGFYKELKKKGIEYAFLAFLAWLGFKIAPEIFHR